MAGGGGKGGQSQSSQQIDPRLAEGAVQGVVGAMRSAALPYEPNRGVQVAAFSPQQQAAFEGASTAAGAFGLPTAPSGGYLPPPEMSSTGFQGYSTGGLYDEIINQSTTEESRQAREDLLSSYNDAAQSVLDTPAPKPAGGGK